MSEREPKVSVVFKQGNQEVRTVIDEVDLVTAENDARLLNHNLDKQSRNLGFKYVVKVKACT